MKLNLILIWLFAFVPLSACAESDDSPDSDTPAQDAPALVSKSHPPLYDPEVHDGGAVGNPNIELGPLIRGIIIRHKITEEEFYAKNPSWKGFENKRPPDWGMTFGYNL